MTHQEIAEAICAVEPADYEDLIDTISEEMLNTYDDSEFDDINTALENKGLDASEWCRKKRPT